MSEISPFLSESYDCDKNIIKHALNQYTAFITRFNGEDENTVRANLIDYFKKNKEKYKSKRAKALIKNKYGDRELKILPLSSVFRLVQEKNYHFSPSMVGYTNSEEEECVNAIGTRLFIDNRSKYKALRQKAKADGNADLYGKYNELQNAFKIFNNAQSGAMSSEGTPINNKSGHTTLTSTCRCLTSTANLINEQFIAGNRFYNTPENTLQSLMARLQVTDYKAVETVMDKYQLHYPTVDEVMDRIIYSSARYWDSAKFMAVIKTFISKLSNIERASILYTLDLITLFRYNRKTITQFFDEFTEVVSPAENKTEKEYLAPDNGDKYVLCVSKLPRNPSKVEVNALNEYHMGVENKYKDLLKVFFKSPIPPSGLFDVISAVRDCVLTSDTDSSIYTVDEMVEEYTESKDKGVKLNALLTYFIRMISVDQHQQLSANLNVSKRNLKLLNMKNEYYFGAYVTTKMSKHYYASQQMVEGVMNETPEMEIKGVHLKSSKIAPSIKQFAQKLMVMTINAIETKTKINPASTLKEVADLERMIVNDIQNGNWEWLSKQSIKGAEFYKNPDSSVSFYHEMWETVFSEKYGNAPELPYTGVKLSVDLGSKTKIKEFISKIEDPVIASKLDSFLTEKAKTDMNNLYIPMERLQYLGDIPIEIKEAIDYRTVIKQNLKCVYEVLNTTGLYFMNKSITRLVSDEH